jgi:hypothetical protein
MRIIGLSAAAAILGTGLLAPLPAFAVSYQLGHRPEIGAIQAPKTTKAGQPIPITVAAKKEGGSGCGLVVSFGDGSDRQLKMNGDDGKFPVTMEHTYKKDGKYTLRASGREITTNKACKGSASTVIQVGEIKPGKPAAKPK